MKKTTKERLIHKKESERTKVEKILRDVVFYGVVIYVAVLGYLLVNANVDLANAQSDYISTCVATTHGVN